MKMRALLAPLVMFCILLPTLGQTQSPQPQKPSDDQDEVVKITTNLVQVDAVVTKDAKPVKNLTVDDFEIYEDGREQTITSFAYISNVPDTTTLPPTAKPKGTDVVPFTPLKQDAPRRTIALVVDDLGLSAQSIGLVRRELKKFLTQEMQPSDLVAIIRTSGEVGALQQFNFRDVTNQMDSLMLNRSTMAFNRRQGGEIIAQQTGGFQVRNTNSFQLDRILEDQSGYYLLGYRPTEKTFNRRFHHIKAKVKRSGMTLRTRYGFFGVSEEEVNKNRRTARDLTNLALMSPFGAQDIKVDMNSFFAHDKIEK